MQATYDFDAFLSYRNDEQDKPNILLLRELLKHYGYKIWFDKEQLRPGALVMPMMEQGLQSSRCGLVLIGRSGIGPWHEEEINVLLNYAVNQKKPLIPVLLPEAIKPQAMPVFLQTRGYVDLSKGITHGGMCELAWGLTGSASKPQLGKLPDFAMTPGAGAQPAAQSAVNPAANAADNYIAQHGHLIHKLKAKDTTGRWAYYFVLVEPDMEAAFLRAMESAGNTDLERFGKVVASCYGEEPTQEVRNYLKEKYGFSV